MGFIIKEIDPGDLTYYGSLEDAAAALEPVDVEHGEYKGFDEAGRRLNIETDGKRVSITLGEISPSHADELRSSLVREVLRYAHHGPGFVVDRQWAESASVDELIARWRALHSMWEAKRKNTPVRRAVGRIMRVFRGR